MQGDAGIGSAFATPVLHTDGTGARPPPQAEELLSIADVADRLGVCRATVYRMVWRGELPHVRIGSAIRIRPSDLQVLPDPRLRG